MLDTDKYIMPKIEKLMKNPKFIKYINLMDGLESDRIFCGHDIDHLLAVSRMMYIINLEESMGLDKELIYAVGLLHDLGRVDEYKNGIDHSIAGTYIAKDLMESAGFSDKEIKSAVHAIGNHRTRKEFLIDSSKKDIEETDKDGNYKSKKDFLSLNKDSFQENDKYYADDKLSDLLKYVDKKSRLCYYCQARDLCNWTEDKKNKTLLL